MVAEDNYSVWEQQELRRCAQLRKRPICDVCGEHIQDEYFYHINGEFICEFCLDQFYRKETEDFTE